MHLTSYISTLGGRVVVDTCIPFGEDTGRYETLVIEESRVRATVASARGIDPKDLYPRRNDIVAYYHTQTAAETGHNAICYALRFMLDPESDTI